MKKNIEIARNHAFKSNLDIKYFKQDLSSLNLKKKFDIILLLEVIEHLDNWKKIISKSIKYLKPKGRIVIWVYGYEGNLLYIYIYRILSLFTQILPDKVLYLLR